MYYLRFACLLILLQAFATSRAQQRMVPGQANYILNARTNSVLFRDTLYSGSRQFRELFLRTNDPLLIKWYRKHQLLKILGEFSVVTGSLAISTGIGLATGTGSTRNSGWIVAGSGLAMVINGGILLYSGQKALAGTLLLFNNKYVHASLDIGMSDNGVGLALNF